MKNDFLQLSQSNRRYSYLIDTLAFMTGTCLAFVEANIWSPAEAYFLVIALVIADFVTGIWIGFRDGSFETRKAKKILMHIIGYTGIMFFAFRFSKSDPLLFFLPSAIFVPVVVINLMSLVKNCSLLGLLPKKLAAWLYKNIDKYKNPSIDEISDFNTDNNKPV